MTTRQISRRRWREFEQLAGHDPYTNPWDLPSSKVLGLLATDDDTPQDSHGDRT